MQRKTLNLNVPYYVKIDFATTYKGDLRKLERQIEEDHIANLRSNCYKERSYSKPLFCFLCGISALIHVEVMKHYSED